MVDDVDNERADVAELKEEYLPEEMQKMSVEERKKYVAENDARRRAIQKEIKQLAAQRQAHIENELKRSGKGAKSLDSAIFESVQKQASKKGITYKGGPKY